MDITQQIQEEEYEFPYHHLVHIQPFSETKHLFWGYRYASYVEKIIETLSKRKFNSLIEIGCGDGKVLKEISKKFPSKKLVGTDYSERSLQFARSFSPHLQFEIKTSEIFDSFVLVEVLEHINPLEMDSFLDSICNNLNKDGFGIITTPCDNVPLNPKHYQHFNKELIDRTFNKHFEITSLEYISATGFGANFIQRLLANRLFILNNPILIGFLYRIYKKYYLNASPANASQLFIVVKKK